MSSVDPLYESRDFSSFSNFSELEVKNIKLEWDLNFDTKTISGLVEHELRVKQDGVASAIFDTSGITVNGDVFVNGQRTDYRFGEKNESLGIALYVTIPEGFRTKDTILKVLIFYSASPKASAVQWLEPEATKGKVHPYVFTQSQAIHARSLLPCMDSPGVKASYSAIVTAPTWCTVLMSAVQCSSSDISSVESPVTKPLRADANNSTFYWKQPVATSAYLIALVGGNLASRDVSDRVRIWSEPEVVDAARYEFDETEEFLKAAEEITGCPYQWGRYDVVTLPPSFPYGGMENPCLTFATPTLLAGDRSLADVIAHEIAHSWTGNLVTNSCWNHFWLNEGWTVWLERKITSKVKNSTEVGRLSAQIGYQHLKESVQGFPPEEQQFTQMVWPLNGEDPDLAFSSVPYEKGFNLLNYLETIIGTEHFEKFAKSYIDNFKFGTVSTGEFRDFFVQFVQDLVNNLNNPTAAEEKEETGAGGNNKRNKRNKKKNESKTATNNGGLTPSKSFVSGNLSILRKVEELDWNALFLSPGMPTYPIDFNNSLANAAHDLAQRWISSRHSHSLSDEVHFHSPRPDMNNWSSQQKCLFLEDLLDAGTAEPFSVNFLANLDHAFGFGSSQNSEIMLRWQQLCIRANCNWIYEPAIQFLTSQGRMKFVRPILRDLRRSQIGGAKVAEVFAANQDTYHPIARKMLGEDLIRIQKEEEAATAAASASALQTNSTKTLPKTGSSQSVKSGTGTPNTPATNGKKVSTASGATTPVQSKSSAPEDTEDDAEFHDARPLATSTEVSPVKVATTSCAPSLLEPVSSAPASSYAESENKVAVEEPVYKEESSDAAETTTPIGEVDEPVQINPAVVHIAHELMEQVERITTPQTTPAKVPPAASVNQANEQESEIKVTGSTSATSATSVGIPIGITAVAAPPVPPTAPLPQKVTFSPSVVDNSSPRVTAPTVAEPKDDTNMYMVFAASAAVFVGVYFLFRHFHQRK